MKISNSYKLFSFTLALVVLIIGMASFAALTIEGYVVRSGQHRFRSFLLAIELFQSSEDLTRMARSYVTTGNPVYEKRYFTILDIRDGKLPRPVNYAPTYWHLAGAGRGSPIAPGEAVALQDLMMREGCTEQELALLRESQANSDQLVIMEKQAFAAVKGLYDDGHGNFTVRRAPDRDYAVSLLFSDKYSGEKARIMAPIQQVMDLIDKRTNAEMSAQESILRRHIVLSLVFIIIALFIVFMKTIHAFHRILHPIERLRSQVAEIATGNYAARCDSLSANEIGDLCAHFNSMAQALETDILRRKQAEETLKKSEEQFRLLLNSTAEAIYGIDLQGNCTFANPSCFRMLGYTDTQHLLGRNMHRLIHHSYPDGTHMAVEDCRIYRAFRKGRGEHVLDEVLWKADGTSFPVEYWSYPQIVNGEVSGAVVTFNDITERKQAEEALRESEEKFFKAFQTSPYVITITRMSDGKFIEVNDTFVSLTGFSREEAVADSSVGMKLWLNEKDRNEVLSSLREGRPVVGREFLFQTKRGEVLTGLVSAQVIQLSQETCILSSIDNITARKQVEDELRRNRRFLSELIEHSGALICVKDRDSRYELVNRKWEESTGFKRRDVLGRTVEELFPGPVGRQLRLNDLEVLESASVLEKEEILEGEHGKRFFLSVKFPLQGDDGVIRGICGMITEITKRKQAEEALAIERQRLSFILEGTNVGTWEWNTRTGEAIFNERWAEIIGYTLAELAPVSFNTWMKFSHPEDLKVSNELLKKHFNKELEYYECETRMRHKNGSWVWVLDRGKVTTWTDDGKPLMMYGTHQDITEHKQTEEKIQHMATHDVMTDLPSLRLARDRLSRAISMAHRYKNTAAVMFIDLDGFKAVNDTLGHDAGDEVLRQVAKRLLACVRETDTVARVGGDEFLLIATELHSPDNAAQIAEKAIRLVSQPVIIHGRQAAVGASIGIALYPDNGEDIDILIKLADEAMYKIKKSGKNNYSFANTAK